MHASRVRTGQGLRLSGAIVTVAIALVVLAPSAPASSSTPTRFHPPYTGTTNFTSGSTFVSSAANGNASIAVGPFAKTNSGRAGSESRAVWNGLVWNGLVGSAIARTTAGFIGPAFKFGAAGVHHVVFHWRASWTASGNISSPTLRLEHPYDHVTVTLLGNVFDNTTGTWVLAANASLLVLSKNATFNVSGARQNFTLALNASLVSGDQYLFFSEMRTWVDAGCWVRVGGPIPSPNSACSAWAKLDLATAGNGAWVVWIGIR